MKVAIINKSDSTGGAAVVSRRLMEALRQQGVDAKMIVIEKLSDSPYVFQVEENKNAIKFKFFLERIKIFIANGFNRATLFKIDTGENGLSLWKNFLVKEADAIILNWVNQGMFSLKGYQNILKLGKPVIWTMHDMWEMTGICHHAGICNNYLKKCGNCPLLGKNAGPNDLSKKIWNRKNLIYSNFRKMKKASFVAVSTWLKEKAIESSLLKTQRVEMIPNAFQLHFDSEIQSLKAGRKHDKIRILFGAARLDDPIKGLDTLKEASFQLKSKFPDIASKLEIACFGNIKNQGALENFSLPVIKLGILKGEEAIKKAYETADIVVSSSSYETLPGTLVEAQAYGCIPVSFNRGGQKDIVEDEKTGFIVEYEDILSQRAHNLAKGIVKAVAVIKDNKRYCKMLSDMRESVTKKFSYAEIARKYIDLIQDMGKYP